jgi:hypothetical protein
MKTSNIITVVVVVALVIVGFIFASKASNKPSEYESFAKGMKDAGVKFYGAFWCPHCQAQEKEFKMSRQRLEKIGLYNECSTPDGKGQLQACTDAKIESYPTWVYPKEFSVTSSAAPTVCSTQPGPSDQPSVCASYGSKFFKAWIFIGKETLTVQSAGEPKHEGSVWTFPAGSRTTGEVGMENLSNFSGVALPKAE